MNRKRLPLLLLAVSAFVFCGLIVFGLRISLHLSDNQSISKFPVQIQEYMASNTLYPNPNGICTDWVELYNSSDSDISIGGFKLTDESRKSRYTVPAGTVIPAHGCYVIYCMRSGGREYADFGISRTGGEELLLLNRKNVLIDSVQTISLPENTSAERDETGVFRIATQPSPGVYAATLLSEAKDRPTDILHPVSGTIRISEIIPGNTLYADAYGIVADLVELVNLSDVTVAVGGYALQDGVDGERFVLPQDAVIDPGGYYLICCARAQRSGLYADFALSRNGGELLLLYTDSDTLTDFLTTLPCGKNEAIVREDGDARVLSFATPGYANTEEGYQACLASYTANAPVRINEAMISNRSCVFPDGTAPDWLELANTTSAEIRLSGYGLSDSASSVRYTFPEDAVLPAGGYLAVPCDGNAGNAANAAHIGLSAAGGETLFLTKPDGTLCSAAVTVRTEADVSLDYSDGILPTVSDQPTPGFANDENGLAAYRATQPTVVRNLRISEIMPSNACIYASENGFFTDWVELYNAGAEPIDLGTYCLSDRADDPTRFRLPADILAPGAYRIVLCDSSAAEAAGEIRAPFGLSSKGGDVLLSLLTGEVIDRATYPAAEKDRSYIRGEAQAIFLETDCPTPGFANTAAGYKAFLTSWVPAGLYLSEVMPANRSVARNNGDYFDWVELCNGSSEPVNLSRYCLTDDRQVPHKYALPDVTLKSGERLLIYCSGKPSLTDKTAYHAPFKLNGGEDHVYLYETDGSLADYLHIYKVSPEGSIGRQSRDSGVYLYETPTPSKQNSDGTQATLLSAMPTADAVSGVFEGSDGFFVSLFGEGTVYYTTDGSKPTVASAVYTEPIRITQTSVLRAAALQPDKRMSDVLTLAYTINEGHTLPVLNLILAPEDFSGVGRGIYRNPQETWQRDACIVYTDSNGTVTHDCGVRISGQHSRTREQKSFKLVFSDQYGGRLRYDIFGDTCEQKSFPELLIRAGLDSKYGLYREPLAQHMALPYRDTTFVQDSVPCVLYINGVYYGIYQFMEALCEETLADRIGVRTDSITLYKGYLYPEHQHLEIYRLLEYVQKSDMTDRANYEYVKAHLALEDLIDWAIFEAYCYNSDLSANVRYFNSSETDGRWHFVFYDVECGFKAPAGFDLVFRTGQTASFLNALIRNSEFKDMFLQRLAYHCENTFRQDRVLSLLHTYDSAVREETIRHFNRWGLQPITYVYNYNQMERLLKADRVKELLQSAKKVLRLTDEEYNSYFRG